MFIEKLIKETETAKDFGTKTKLKINKFIENKMSSFLFLRNIESLYIETLSISKILLKE